MGKSSKNTFKIDVKKWEKAIKIFCHPMKRTTQLGGEKKATQPIFGKSNHTSNQRLKVSPLIQQSRVKVLTINSEAMCGSSSRRVAAMV